MNGPKVLTMQDKETLCMIAEDVLDELCSVSFYDYDKDGNRLSDKPPEGAASCQAAEQQALPWNYLILSKDEGFRRIEFPKLREMPVEAIQERYLADVLPKARGVLRKGTMDPAFTVSDEVPDSCLNEIFAMTWLGKLIGWTTARETVKETEGKSHDYPDRRYPQGL